MMSNITVDVAIGFIPIIGDIADAVFKANVKNLIILEDYLKKVYAPKAGDTPMKQVDNPAFDGVDDGLRRPDTGKKSGGWLNGITGGTRREKDVAVNQAPLREERRQRDEFQETGTVHNARH